VIHKLSRPGRGFGPVLRYLLQPHKDHEIVAGNVRGDDAVALGSELDRWRDLNPDVVRPVFSASLSVAPGNQLSAAGWRQVAEKYIEKMHLDDSPWVAVRHRDTDYDHIHIVASRIRNDGKLVDGSFERWRGLDVCRQIEREMNLTRLAPARESFRRGLDRRELAVFEHTGRVSVSARLQQHVAIAARGGPTASEWVARLEAQGVDVKLRIDSAGRVVGVSFALDGVALRGSDLGRAYTWRGLLQHQGVRFQPVRDLPALAAASARAGTVAARVPAPRPPPGGVPAQPHPVAAYRQAASLEARAEIHERGLALEAEQMQAVARAVEAASRLADQRRLEGAAAGARGAYREALARIYRDPPAAFRELERSRAGEGVEAAAVTLERRPETFGRLRGLGAGRLGDAARREALAAAPRAAYAFREAAELAARVERADRERQAAGAGGPAGAGGADGAGRSLPGPDAAQERAAAAALGHAREQLPRWSSLQEEILRSARALGDDTVKVLSATAVRAVRAAALATGRSLARGLAQGLGFGPDDGLGR
jgi:hypothetical protein